MILNPLQDSRPSDVPVGFAGEQQGKATEYFSSGEALTTGDKK